jgi:hypothetical protein
MEVYNRGITYVTAFIDLKEDRSEYRTPEVSFNHFKRLASCGINICLFVSKIYLEEALKACNIYSNIYLMPTVELEDLEIYRIIKSVDLKVPETRNIIKDTYNYMALMNCKTEFVLKALESGIFNTTHYSWIDFNICHIIKTDNILEKLYKCSTLLKDNIMLLPSCWSKDESIDNILLVSDGIYWRFCGGFFIGDRMSMLDFHRCYEEYYLEFLEDTKKILWEVNFWAWIEYKSYWNPEYYISIHDDSMLNIPDIYIIN